MNKYINKYDLQFDPFASEQEGKTFFVSENRKQMLDQIIEMSLYSNAMIAVTGSLGSGKTTLVNNLSDSFADEAVCIKVSATLFMNETQFLETIVDLLPINLTPGADTDSLIDQVCQYAVQLDMEVRSLILIVDDAHELSSEVLDVITLLLDKCVDSSIHALLFGEPQLDNMLNDALSDPSLERLALFELEGLSREETLEYIRFKLASAGYSKDLPLAGEVIGGIHNKSNGMPGSIDQLVAEALESTASDFEEQLETNPSPEAVSEMHNDSELSEVEPASSDVPGSEPSKMDLPNFEVDRPDLVNEDESENKNALTRIMHPRYWAAAAVIVLVMGATFLFWDTETEFELSEATTTIAISTDLVAAIEEPAEESLKEEEEQAQTQELADNTEDVSVINTEISEDIEVPVSPELVSNLDGVAAPTVEEPAAELIAESEQEILKTENSDIQQIDVAEIETPAPQEETQISQTDETVVPESEISASGLVSGKLSDFENKLLQEPAQNFTVQILGSHSESNVKNFIAKLDNGNGYGYFETRYQSKPWYVVVLGYFNSRDAASEAISELPARLQDMQPWVRSVANIQSSITQLNAVNLVQID